MRLNVPLAHGLAALALCAAPLLAQANCTSTNTDADYILGDADGTASAMHWETGLVWKRCLEGQSFDRITNQCTGTALAKPWNDWMVDFMPQSFADLSDWWKDVLGYTPPTMPSNPPNRLLTGDWRMAYKNELVSITENCGNNPKLNRVVFPNAQYSSYVWSGSPDANDTYYALDVDFNDGVSGSYLRYLGLHVRLVRAGQSFAPLASPAAKTAAAGVTTDFAPITLAPSTGSGQAWGGVRISDDGSPEFQINGAGAWVQEAIVKSGDQITVRLTAPAAGSSTAKLTLRSGQTTGSADVAKLGDEETKPATTTADFTLTALAAPVTAQPIPTLGEWAMLLMAGLLGLLGAGALRRQGALQG